MTEAMPVMHTWLCATGKEAVQCIGGREKNKIHNENA